MKRLLTLVLLEGMACAQTVSPALSANERVPPAGLSPSSPPVTSNSSNHPVPVSDLLPKPEGKPTLIGGTISQLDRVRDEITIQVFGGGRTRVLFDPRTHIYRDGVLASEGALQNGARVYVDTMLAGKTVFAKNIRVVTQGVAGESVGQVVRFDSRRGELVLNDAISPSNVRIRVLPSTKMVSQDGHTISTTELVSGTLVSVAFASNGGEATARQVSIVAVPGNAFVFVGRVTHLDLHLGLLVVIDPRDQKSYEIEFRPSAIEVSNDLREGATVEATTRFNGRRYVASAIKVESNSTP